MIHGSACSKSRLAKAAGAEVAVQQGNETWYAAVAKSRFVSQNVKNMRWSGPLFEVQMSKHATPLWREAHLQVKMRKTPPFWQTFGASHVEKVFDKRDR